MRPVLFAAITVAALSPALAAEPAVPANPPAAAIAAAPAPVKKSAGIALTMDEVRTITFAKPITTVYVGNPSIADITMIDARHAFIQGKGFGRTNIVALNHDGVQVYNARIDVAQSGAETLTLNRGVHRVTYNCSNNRCELAPTPGDAKEVFEQMAGEISGHSDAARKAAGN